MFSVVSPAEKKSLIDMVVHGYSKLFRRRKRTNNHNCLTDRLFLYNRDFHQILSRLTCSKTYAMDLVAHRLRKFFSTTTCDAEPSTAERENSGAHKTRNVKVDASSNSSRGAGRSHKLSGATYSGANVRGGEPRTAQRVQPWLANRLGKENWPTQGQP